VLADFSYRELCTPCTCVTKAAEYLTRGNRQNSPCEVYSPEMEKAIYWAMIGTVDSTCPAAVRGPVTDAMMRYCKWMLPEATILDAARTWLAGGEAPGARTRAPGGARTHPGTAKATPKASPRPTYG
jgi:hypothetical protein